jgi:hypothetical protein
MGRFCWNWLPAVKTAGGILVGISSEVFDIVRWDIFSYCVSVQIKAKKTISFGEPLLCMALLMKSIN